MNGYDCSVLARARRWRQWAIHRADVDDETAQLVTDLEAALRAHVEELPVA